MVYNDIITSLDIGTSNVCAMIGEINEEDKLEIIGVGTAPSRGIRNGSVINIEATQESITKAIQEAERVSNRKVDTVNINISSTDIRGINSRGVVAVNGPGREITQEDIDRVLEISRAKNIPLGHEIIHLIPRMYFVDEIQYFAEPLNMIGTRLETVVHLITASAAAIHNLINSIDRAGYNVSTIHFENLASEKATLTTDEKNIGCLFMNIGGGTTDVILYRNGAPQFSCVLPLGGINVTSDIATILKIPILEAESIKLQSGFCYSPVVDEGNALIVIPGIAGSPPISTDRNTLCSYIEPRMQEIFELVQSYIEKEFEFISWNSLGSVVLCGGGAMLPGVEQLAESVFSVPARVAEPINVNGLTKEVSRPDRSTAYGLILLTLESLNSSHSLDYKSKTPNKFLQWIRNFFE